MTRIFAIAAVLAFAANSANASEVRVSVAGKSFEQIQADVRAAAHTVCAHDTADQPLIAGAYSACVRQSYKAALAQLRV